jgi:class 3 adenylate cyclase
MGTEDQKTNILYIDDEENNLISFRAAFRRMYNVHTANGGPKGLAILRNTEIPIIITDQRMPEMTGVQFLEKVKTEYPDTIRMILTGFSDIEAVIEAINLGQVYRYIIKPWDGKDLQMIIDNAIKVYNLQKANKNLLTQLDERLKDKERTLELFKKYVPPTIIEKALQSEDGQSIFEGELREVSVLFCDIRGFTEMISDLSPREVVEFLNFFYGLMARSIKKYNGYTNQYIGDEILAIFGAPLSYPENQSNVVYCALDMIEQLKAINERYKDKLNREFNVGIGINSGQVVAGNLGWEEKLAYSVTGDTVNVGKRIETLTKDSPNCILISDSTYQSVNDLFQVKSWDPVMVKGKSEEMVVHEVLGRL